ncbi:MAG: recombinase RecA [Chloroflexi bacterium]|nr:recombinase RecA [Chloroflexota bacterium]MCH2308452.1 recombinase RecA [SAR202 cluster bacterium]MQG05189.1 recombinase RecA [SAR202 cluster bacterium]
MATSNKKDLDLAISQIERQFGAGTLVKLGDSNLLEGVESISTGSLSLDIALGIGGIPRGRVTEIFGAESSGKTTLAYHIIAQAQKSGGAAAYLDAEHALDPEFANRCGVDTTELFISQPDSAEQALEVCEYLVRSGALDVVVIDSVAALVPKAELEGDMGDTHVGLQARLMSQALRKLTAAIGESKTSVIFINQVREKVGIMWGNPEVTPGGRALKFYSSVRIDLRRIESVKSGTEIIGNRVKARMVKNKVAPPFRVAEFEILFKEGISRESDLIDLGDLTKVIKKSGAYFSYEDHKLGQGRENAKKFLKENAEIAKEITEKIYISLAEADGNSI